MHGGRIEARSDGLDRGSEFLIYLPMMSDSQRRASKTTPLQSSQSPVSARRILIVDDTRAAGYVLGKLLETMGQQVRTVTDASEALESVRRERPDVVISDIGMPNIDGYELARRLREAPDSERLILVALTGYGQEADKQQAKAAGFDYHLVKPLSLEALQDLLATLPTPLPIRNAPPIALELESRPLRPKPALCAEPIGTSIKTKQAEARKRCTDASTQQELTECTPVECLCNRQIERVRQRLGFLLLPSKGAA
jgi:CheY-like chemotaxis protein